MMMETSDLVALVERNSPPLLEKVRAARPYKIPKGFLNWRSLPVFIAGVALLRDQPGQDFAQQTVFYRLTLWLIQDAPLYCMSQSLLEAFTHTDILDRQDLLQGLEAPIPTFMLLLPSNMLKTPADHAVELMVVHISDRLYPERSMGRSKELDIDLHCLEHEKEMLIHCGVKDVMGCVWLAVMGWGTDGVLHLDNRWSGGSPSEPGDLEFLNTLRSLTLQVIMALQYQPELLNEGEPPAQPKGFSRPKQTEPNYRIPRWLGKNFQPKTNAIVSSSTGTHASPRTHWRKGHLRQVAIGEGRSDRKVVWIQPVLVNSD
jgi:hypothetical protein